MKTDIARQASPPAAGFARGKRMWLSLAAVTILFVISTGTTSAHITTLVPSSIIAGSPDFTLTIRGYDIEPSERVLWNGAPLDTMWDSSDQVRALVPARLVASPGSVNVILGRTEGFNTLVFTINPPTETSLLINDVEVREGETGTVNAIFTVSLSAASNHVVTVDYATSDGAGPFAATAADNDYISKSGTLTFPANHLKLTIEVPIIGDSKPEADERFFVNLTNPVGTGIAKAQGVCTIVNDDFISSTHCSTDVPKAFVQGEAKLIIEVRDSLILQTVDWTYSTDDHKYLHVALTSPAGSTVTGGPSYPAFSDCRQLFTPIVPSLIPWFTAGQKTRGTWTVTLRDDESFLPDPKEQLLCWCLKILGSASGVGLHVQGAFADIFSDGPQIPVFNNVTVVATVLSDTQPISNAQVTFYIRDKQGNSPIIKEENTDGRGLAVLNYTREQTSEDRISAVVRVNGLIIAEKTWGLAITWFPLECPILTATSPNAHGAESTLNVLRKFRDDDLSQTPRGRRYTQLYYKFSSEAVRIMMFNPILLLRSREAIERYKPVIQAMVDGEPVNLTSGDLDEIEGFLNLFAARASPEFQLAVHDVCRDLRDPEVHADFGIKVTDGPKREVSSASAAGLPTSIVNSIGASLGLFALVAVGRQRMNRNVIHSHSRRRRRRTDVERPGTEEQK